MTSTAIFTREQTRSSILAGIRHALATQLIPALKSDSDVVTGHMLVRLLDYLEESSLPIDASLAGREGLPADLAAELSSLAQQPVAARNLDTIAAALAKLCGSVDRTQPAHANLAFLRKLAAHEARSLATIDARGQAGVAASYAKGVVALGQEPQVVGAPPLTEETLTRAVRRCDRFGAAARAHSIVEIPGGYNKLTAMFVVSSHGKDEHVVIRRDAVPNPTGFSTADEFETLQAVWRAGTVPIAEPLLRETDTSVLGSPFILVRRMPGSTNIEAWKKVPGAGRKLAGTLAEALARLHAIDLRRFLRPGTEPLPLQRYARQEIERWQQRSDRWRVRPRPAIDAGFAWMLANVPTAARKPVLVHGDVGFHNLLMDAGRVTALLDWEFSHIGDPMEDLAYCKPFVSEVCPFDEFAAMYVESGGCSIDPAAIEYYSVWPSLRNGSGCDALLRVFLENPGSDLKFAVAGLQHVRHYENAILSFLSTRAN